MIKFKRVNIINLASKYGCHYLKLDILRQTGIERLIDFGNIKHVNKQQFIDAMLVNAKLLLNEMIKETEK